jgi:hypothetical protein
VAGSSWRVWSIVIQWHAGDFQFSEKHSDHGATFLKHDQPLWFLGSATAAGVCSHLSVGNYPNLVNNTRIDRLLGLIAFSTQTSKCMRHMVISHHTHPFDSRIPDEPILGGPKITPAVHDFHMFVSFCFQMWIKKKGPFPISTPASRPRVSDANGPFQEVTEDMRKDVWWRIFEVIVGRG